MVRNLDMDEISDGKLYEPNDLVRADCGDCQGCSDCCREMGETIILDPLDIYRMTAATKKTFDELLESHAELHVVDGVILPNLKMDGESEQCTFLNDAGRCAIHPARPGICRIFPLGRVYDGNSFRYFLQKSECSKSNRAKVKVKKWIDTPDIRSNEAFITDWHFFIRELQSRLTAQPDMELAKKVNLFVLEQFYFRAYSGGEDFYVQFSARLNEAKKRLSDMPVEHG